MQGLDQRIAVLEHGALVDRALVGDLALVDGRRLVHQVQAGDAVGAARGVPRELVQSQVYLSMQDVSDPHKRVVIRLILTVTAAQEDAVRGDFQEFLRSVAPDTGTAGTDAGPTAGSGE